MKEGNLSNKPIPYYFLDITEMFGKFQRQRQ